MSGMLDMLAAGAISVLVAERVFISAVAESPVIDICSDRCRTRMVMEQSIDIGDDETVSIGISLLEVESIDMPETPAAGGVDIGLTGSCGSLARKDSIPSPGLA